MEIKKYVLLDNNNILEISSPNNLNNDDLEYFSQHMTKTSDNILDLIEVGDLIQCYYEKKSSDGETWIETPIYYVNGISETHYHLPVFSIEKDDKHIKAIYKKQTNGDYKKYEVKES